MENLLWQLEFNNEQEWEQLCLERDKEYIDDCIRNAQDDFLDEAWVEMELLPDREEYVRLVLGFSSFYDVESGYTRIYLNKENDEL